MFRLGDRAVAGRGARTAARRRVVRRAACRLELLLADPATAPHEGGVLVVDDSGGPQGRQCGRTCGQAAQYLGSVGKIDRGVVTVTTCWADERVSCPLHAVPCTRPSLPAREE
ncbi:transposase [Streptomyces sp. NPDC048637]|uniref:transposase n=1 Tax=Streptomyces sp. NPDC048637 TaxID=3155636 RepID=UPI0034217D10